MKHFASLSFMPRLGGRRASFELGVVATLAIAVGANIAVLGNLGVLFGRVVPGAAHQNLYEPYFQALQFKALPPSQLGIFRPMYDRFAASLAGRADTAMYEVRSGTLEARGGRNPANFTYLHVTPSLAKVLGVQIVAGRMLIASDAERGAAPAMVIAAQFARARFGSPEAAIGKTLKLNGKTYRVVGVLPAALSFPAASVTEGSTTQGWTTFAPQAPGPSGDIEFGLYALVYPHAGLTREAILTALTRAYTQSLADYNSGMRGFVEQMKIVPRVEPLAQREYGSVTTQLQLLEIAALLLLLLVFANLAGLSTSDALARRHELATRVALGAGLFRLFAERARELGLLGLIGWVIGIGLGWLGSRALALVIGQAGTAAVFSTPVLLFTLVAVLVITTLLAATGIRRLHAPRILCADLMSGGHATGGRGLTRALRAFIVLQLAVSVVLLVTAGHLRANVFGLTHGDLGFTPAQRTFFRVALPDSYGNQTDAQYEAYVSQARAFDREFLRQANGLAGIKSTALLNVIPFSNGTSTTNAGTTSANANNGPLVNAQTVSSQIAPALGLRVVAGSLNDVFSGNGNAIFLDEAAVELFWPKARPAAVIGRTLYSGKAYRVVAVVEPLRMKPYGSVGGTMFLPFDSPSASLSGGPQGFAVHSALPPKILRNEVTKLAQQINPQARVIEFHSADELVAAAYAARGHLAQVFGTLALVAILIAAIGLFALLAYRALVRRPEFAIRAALGATQTRLRLMVLKEAFLLWLIGCAIGIPAAYELGRVLAASQPELGLPATATVVAVLVAVAVITVFAALIPARRAARANAATDLHG